MEKFLELTKSISAFIALIALVLISLTGVTALNPVSKLVLTSAEQNVAGLQYSKAENGKIFFEDSTDKIRIKDGVVEFNVEPGVKTADVGHITLRSSQNSPLYTYISANLGSDLHKLVRIELIDKDNKIILSDFTKDFEKQKISFENQTSRTFKVRYLLQHSINYTSRVTLKLQ